MITTIAFDADDTLWHNERFFRLTQARLTELLRDYVDSTHLAQHLLAAERRNLGHYGYGIKGFMLSMIETAIDVTDEKVPASVIRELIDAGREMLRHPIELLPDVEETVGALSGDFRLMVITKGDLLDQERKLAQSGLGDLFDRVEIVSEKDAATYARIFGPEPGGAAGAMMIGNSMKSDVLPAIGAGSWGIWVPHDATWELEAADPPEDEGRYRRISRIGEVPGLLADINMS